MKQIGENKRTHPVSPIAPEEVHSSRSEVEQSEKWWWVFIVIIVVVGILHFSGLFQYLAQ
jgi:hypothetical protein